MPFNNLCFVVGSQAMIGVSRFLNNVLQNTLWEYLNWLCVSIILYMYIYIYIFFFFQDAVISYARLQLNLTRGAADGSPLVEQLLDVVGRELDQTNISSTSVPWWGFVLVFFPFSVWKYFLWLMVMWMCFAFRSDTTKDDRLGTLTSSQCGLVELAALVFYRVVGLSICSLVFHMMLSAVPFVYLSLWNLIIYNVMRIK